ncbi:formate dehydrogenase accessory sulfurtransferase FdhD [Namhaeicola litoreus]|uniref:Sulfur carrier protein FdhD n=1 Tax=Namhaeicola litoreus TaxID=1052145 RepID=A0ABW3Y418_9FLAO
MAFTFYQGKKFFAHSSQMVEDALTVEESLEMSLNGTAFSMTMRTPGNDNEFIHGYLFTEDIYTDKAEDLQINVLKKNEDGITKAVDILVPEHRLKSGYRNSRNFLSLSSCGICGKTELDELEGKLEDGLEIEAGQIENMFDMLNNSQKTFKKSGGSHAAAAFTGEGVLLSVMEDIGRHNAVDKVIGDLIIKNNLNKVKVLIVSGRISYEIVMKAFRAHIPILAAVSAPSTLAVDFSKELGITLLGFCRDDKATCYAHTHRIKSKIQKNVEEFK